MVEMTVEQTPVEHYPEFGMWVKREDLCCPGGPNFSKTRGVFPHVRARNEGLIGVLDTYHSQGGWAVARACQLLGKRCQLFYPVRKSEQAADLKPQQRAAAELGAELVPLPAGRSAVLYHKAKRTVEGAGGYMMPNALKLPETVENTAAEFVRTIVPQCDVVLVSASSATIAAGVWLGLFRKRLLLTPLVVHLGYSRGEWPVRNYMERMTGLSGGRVDIVDEGYAYGDRARPGPAPRFPCNEFYDLKAFRWWQRVRGNRLAFFWNVG